MANYKVWNNALIEYFISGAPLGSTIYLNISDITLEIIGRQFCNDTPSNNWAEDFLEAVRTAWVKDGCVTLPEKDHDTQGNPQYVAFLATLVLAANRMDKDREEDIHQSDYFTRLNEVLTTQPANKQVKRPKDMLSGADSEEPLWKAWAQYLRSLDYLPTASGGEGSWKYIGYAVSQAMIRERERKSLFELFETYGWTSDIEADYLVQRLRKDSTKLSQHMKELLGRSGSAFEDVVNAIYEVYQEWRLCEKDSVTSSSQNQRRNLQAGLYRTQHFRTGEPFYEFFPRQPRGLRQIEIEVEFPQGSEKLSPERPGYYEPLGEVTSTELNKGCSFHLSGHPLLESLVLPRRKVWVLRADPENSGDYASLGKAEVGEHILLLVKASLAEQLTSLREQKFVEWHSCEAVAENCEDWLEYREFMVLSYRWNNLEETYEAELMDALRPQKGVSISIEGGLRLKGTQKWLKNNPPQISITCFSHEVELRVHDEDDKTIFQEKVAQNIAIDIPWSGSGNYKLIAHAEFLEQKDEKHINLVDRDSLNKAKPESLGKFSTSWSQDDRCYHLKGAVLTTELL